jgi:hypothetical protein
MFLTAGTLSIDGGRLEVGELVPTSDLLPPGRWRRCATT